VLLVAEYRITIKPSAVKEIDRLPLATATRVATRIKALAESPRPAGVKKLEGDPARWRIRVSDWRIIFTIDDEQHVVDVLYVRHRSKAYD
jgi:mRNA interferase RelE/StbE